MTGNGTGDITEEIPDLNMDDIESITVLKDAADCYHLWERGAITPGRFADFFFSDSLSLLKPEEVYVQGELVANNGKIIKKSPHVEPEGVSGSVNIKDISLSTFSLPLKSNKARVIEILPGGVVTKKGEAEVKRDENGEWVHDKVTVNKDNTTIVNGHGEKANIQDRVAQIKNEIENTKSSYDKEKLQERLAKLAGGVAVLYLLPTIFISF